MSSTGLKGKRPVQYVGVSIDGGTSINGWFIRENPNLRWMMAGGTHIYGTPHGVVSLFNGSDYRNRLTGKPHAIFHRENRNDFRSSLKLVHWFQMVSEIHQGSSARNPGFNRESLSDASTLTMSS